MSPGYMANEHYTCLLLIGLNVFQAVLGLQWKWRTEKKQTKVDSSLSHFCPMLKVPEQTPMILPIQVGIRF